MAHAEEEGADVLSFNLLCATNGAPNTFLYITGSNSLSANPDDALLFDGVDISIDMYWDAYFTRDISPDPTCRYVRLQPVDIVDRIGLRWELYVCTHSITYSYTYM